MNYWQKLFIIPGAVLLSGCTLTSGGSDGGFLRSDDGGGTFTQKVQLNEKTKISGVDVLCLAANPQNGDELFMGTKASGIFRTIDRGEDWNALETGSATAEKIYAIAVDQFNPRTVYAGAVVSHRAKILKTEDAGETWKEAYSEAGSGTLILSLALDLADPRRIFAGTDKGQIIFSDNGGETWQSLYWGSNPIYRIAFDRFDANLIYFVNFQNGLLRTRDGGETFDEIKADNLFDMWEQFRNPTAIAVDPNRAGWVYLGTDQGLLRSKDTGASWEMVKTLNKTDEDTIRSIAINPFNSDEIIYAAKQAFFKSIDGGISWSVQQFDAQRTIEVLLYDPIYPTVIYAGMNKR